MIRSKLYRCFPLLHMACRNLTRTKVRSTPAILGIIIGVVAIASLGMFGTTLQRGATNSIGSIGNQVAVTPAGKQDGIISERESREIAQAAGSNATAIPITQQQAAVSTARRDELLSSMGSINRRNSFAHATVASGARCEVVL